MSVIICVYFKLTFVLSKLATQSKFILCSHRLLRIQPWEEANVHMAQCVEMKDSLNNLLDHLLPNSFMLGTFKLCINNKLTHRPPRPYCSYPWSCFNLKSMYFILHHSLKKWILLRRLQHTQHTSDNRFYRLTHPCFMD